jgi:hypothetical protein
MLAVLKSTDWELQAERALKLTGAACGDEVDVERGEAGCKVQKQQKTAAVDGDEKSKLITSVKHDQSIL